MLSAHIKQLLSILNDNQYHSGTEIGHVLGLTRSGIWKLIKQLEALNIEIESVTNRGYRLKQEIELLNKNEIKKNLDSVLQNQISDILLFDELPSTNDYLLEHLNLYKSKQIVCMAEQQTAGRGRLGREWVSPFAANIYLSFLWHYPGSLSQLAGLNIVVAISIFETLSTLHPALAELQLKWPNDLLYQDKKLAGVLIDVKAEYGNACSVVIGIGINVNMSHTKSIKISKPWTDLLTITGENISRNKISGILLNKLILNLKMFSEKGMPTFIHQWNQHDYLAKKNITVKSADKTIHGIAQGINEKGYLLLKTPEEILDVVSGDASVARIK